MNMRIDKARGRAMPQHIPVKALIVVLALTLAFAGCEGSKTDSVASNRTAQDPNHPELFNLRPEQMSHVQVVTIQPTTLTRVLRLTGAVAYNNFRTTPVITQVSGPVSRVLVVPGQKVRQGQPMLYVASPDYSQLRTNYLKAKDAYSLAEKTYARAQDLYQHHAIAVKDLEQAESAEVQAGGDVASAEAALKVMGVTDPDAVAKGPSSYEVPVRAPIGGEVVEQLVSAGQLLQPGNTQCFTISDTSTVWVLVNVYQKDLPYVRIGDAVDFEIEDIVPFGIETGQPVRFDGMFHPVAPNLTAAEATRSRISAFGIEYEGKSALSTSEFSWAA